DIRSTDSKKQLLTTATQQYKTTSQPQVLISCVNDVAHTLAYSENNSGLIRLWAREPESVVYSQDAHEEDHSRIWVVCLSLTG
ncbi:hypothetical protein BaRGS_00040021, partial [Batillaria attramentaria]